MSALTVEAPSDAQLDYIRTLCHRNERRPETPQQTIDRIVREQREHKKLANQRIDESLARIRRVG